jgi:N-methylhydantoinase B
VKEFEALVDGVTTTHRGERHYFAAGGSQGGLAGAKAYSVLKRTDGSEEVIPSKLVTTMNKGDRLLVMTAGGGGYGDPQSRDRDAVRQDVKDGKVSKEAARERYKLAAG